jgi:glyoxylase-like metal-dependent hydrolase (beta-lactamase superfamily II)
MSPGAPLECAIVEAGHCRHLEALVVRGGRWGRVRLPALVGVLRHPSEGVVLFDTGYAPRIREAAAGWPRRLYPWIVPFSTSEATSARAALARRGIAPEDVRTIVVSHFHPDHVGGLRDFPRARIVATAEAWRRVERARSWGALRLGYLPDLLPADFRERLHPVEGFADGAYGPFPGTHDLFGDGRLRLVPLPGHAAGQVGLLAEVNEGRRVLFVADACWVSAGYQRLAPPSRLTRLVTDDPHAQRLSLERIHLAWRSDPGLLVVPSHCPSLAGERACA